MKESRKHCSIKNYLIDLKRKEESQRIGSDLDQKLISQFSYLQAAMEDDECLRQFIQMQKIYVFNNEYLISSEELQNEIYELRKKFA